MLTEKRLIDANALKEKLQKHHDFFVDGVGVVTHIVTAISTAKQSAEQVFFSILFLR